MTFESASTNISQNYPSYFLSFGIVIRSSGDMASASCQTWPMDATSQPYLTHGNTSSPRSWYPFVHNHDSLNNVLHRCVATILSSCHSFSSILLSFPFSSSYPNHPDGFKSLVFFQPFDFILYFRISAPERVIILSLVSMIDGSTAAFDLLRCSPYALIWGIRLKVYNDLEFSLLFRIDEEEE